MSNLEPEWQRLRRDRQAVLSAAGVQQATSLSAVRNLIDLEVSKPTFAQAMGLYPKHLPMVIDEKSVPAATHAGIGQELAATQQAFMRAVQTMPRHYPDTQTIAGYFNPPRVLDVFRVPATYSAEKFDFAEMERRVVSMTPKDQRLFDSFSWRPGARTVLDYKTRINRNEWSSVRRWEPVAWTEPIVGSDWVIYPHYRQRFL